MTSRILVLLRLAWRDSRFARKRLFLFLSAISLGVAALVGVRSYSADLDRAAAEQAREILGADIEISATHPLEGEVQTVVDSLAAAGWRVARSASLVTMTRVVETDETRLVALRATDPAFPFYGAPRGAEPGAWEAIADAPRLFGDPALLAGLGVGRGDRLALGEAEFGVMGAVEPLPAEAGPASAFAPAVYIGYPMLERTGLGAFGARVSHARHLRAPPGTEAEAVAEVLRDRFGGGAVRVRSVAEREEALAGAFDQLGRFLGLLAVLALLLGGLGVASAMGLYLSRREETVAVLRCLGASSRQVIVIYLLQALALGLAGAVVGALAGLIVHRLLPGIAGGLLPVEVTPGFHPGVLLLGVAVGVWTAAVFALLPLLALRRISPLRALRRKVEASRIPRPWRDPPRLVVWALLLASVFGLVYLQTRSLPEAAGFMVGGGAALLLIGGVVVAVVRLLRGVRLGFLRYPVRQGIAGIHRPGSRARVVILTLGFGIFLLGTVQVVESTLVGALSPDRSGMQGNLILFDVQDHQVEGVVRAVEGEEAPVLRRAPIIPMRLAEVDGRSVRELIAEADERAWALQREYRSTVQASMRPEDRVVAGPRAWPELDGEPWPISLEDGVAETLGVEIGDEIVWDVEGLPVATRIVSLRAVDWTRFEPNFFAVFPPEALAGAPRTWILLTDAESPEETAAIQSAVVRAFPNVTAVDLRRVRETVDRVLGTFTAGIRFLAGFTVAAGFIVLAGTVAASRIERLREAALLKTLGATRAQVLTVLASESGIVGLLSALVGIMLALAAGWVLARWVFEIPLVVPGVALGVLGAATVALTLFVSLWTGREVFRRTAMAVLRDE